MQLMFCADKERKECDKGEGAKESALGLRYEFY